MSLPVRAAMMLTEANSEYCTIFFLREFRKCVVDEHPVEKIQAAPEYSRNNLQYPYTVTNARTLSDER